MRFLLKFLVLAFLWAYGPAGSQASDSFSEERLLSDALTFSGEVSSAELGLHLWTARVWIEGDQVRGQVLTGSTTLSVDGFLSGEGLSLTLSVYGQTLGNYTGVLDRERDEIQGAFVGTKSSSVHPDIRATLSWNVGIRGRDSWGTRESILRWNELAGISQEPTARS